MSTDHHGASGRILPHSEEAEQGLLGSILNLPTQTMELCSDTLESANFYLPPHQVIYSALVRMFETRKQIDIITLGQFLQDDGQLESAGGRVYITSLLNFVPTAANAPYYLDIVRRKFVRREIIRQGTEIVRRSYEENIEEKDLLDQTLADLALLAQERVPEESLRHIWEGIQDTMDKFDVAASNRGKQVVTGLPTGFNDLDRMTSGMKPQQLITIAALTSHGKSAIINNIADHLAVVKNIPCGKWSLEMSYGEEADRFACSRAQVSLQRLRDGHFSEKDIAEIPERLAPFKSAPLWVDDSRGLSIFDLRARVMRAVRKYGLKIVMIDYLGLLSSPTKRAQNNRALEIAEISGGLKSLAKELGIPIILAAQLNRESDRRASVFRRPKLSDLKDSSSIEQDSDVVIFVWRPGRFAETADDVATLKQKLRLDQLNEHLREASRRQEEIDGESLQFDPLTIATVEDGCGDYAEAIVAKQRNGAVGTVHLRFVSDLTKFENVTTKMWSNNPKERQQHA